MRNKILLMISVIFMLFIIPISLANPSWWQEGNSDNDLGGSGLGFTLWGSSINNPYDEINYTKCTIGGSLFNMVSDDFDYDGKREIVATGLNKLNLYDMNCNLKDIIQISSGNGSYFVPTPRNYNFGFYAGYPDTYYNNTDYVLIDDTSYKHTILNASPLRFIQLNLTPEVFTENVVLNIVASPYNSSNYGQTVYFTDFTGSVIYGNLTLHNNLTLIDYNVSIVGALGEQNIYIRGFENNTGITWDYLEVVLNIETAYEYTGISAMPVVMDSFSNGVPELYVLTNESLNIYQFSNASNDYIMVYSFNYYEEFGDSNLDYLTCVNDFLRDPYCHAFKTGTLNIWSFNMDTLEMDYKPSELTYAIESTTGVIGDGIANGRLAPRTIESLWDYITLENIAELNYFLLNPVVYLGVRSSAHFLGEVLHIDLLETSEINQQFRIPVCHAIATASNNRMYCNMLDADGYNLGSPIVSSYNVGAGETLEEISSGIAKHGSQMRLFVKYLTTNTHKDIAEMYDSDGNELYQKVLTQDTNNRMSNWFVLDFNKDGVNDACIFIKETGSTFLKCYYDDMTALVNINTTSVFNDPSLDMIMADFVPNNDYMCFADRNGIFCPNSTTGGVTQVYNTLLPIINGTGMTVYSDAFNSPAYIFTSQTSGMIIKNPLANSDCGDGVCGDAENFYSCPADCDISSIEDLVDDGEYPEGYGCEEDDDCEYGLKCQYGVCTTSGLNQECDENTDCISDLCINGLCTKPSWWDGIDASKDQIAGDDSETDFFISFTILIFISAGIMLATRSIMGVVAGVLVFFIGSIFFAFVGWLSPFILLGELVVMLLGVVLFFVAGGSDS